MLDKMGTAAALDFQQQNPRRDTQNLRKQIQKAVKMIHRRGYVVNSDRVNEELIEGSYVPIIVSTSGSAIRLEFNSCNYRTHSQTRVTLAIAFA